MPLCLIIAFHVNHLSAERVKNISTKLLSHSLTILGAACALHCGYCVCMSRRVTFPLDYRPSCNGSAHRRPL